MNHLLFGDSVRLHVDKVIKNGSRPEQKELRHLLLYHALRIYRYLPNAENEEREAEFISVLKDTPYSETSLVFSKLLEIYASEVLFLNVKSAARYRAILLEQADKIKRHLGIDSIKKD